MTVAVAHQVSATSRQALVQAVAEAKFRSTDLAVLHVVESIDADSQEAYRLGVSDEIEKVLGAQQGAEPAVAWRLHLATAGADVTGALLGLVDGLDADLLVIGARRRSPVGKALLGSITQSLLLQADLPVLVVKAPDHAAGEPAIGASSRTTHT
jgi:nucleotide-binding universal stress UspA family protein